MAQPGKFLLAKVAGGTEVDFRLCLYAQPGGQPVLLSGFVAGSCAEPGVHSLTGADHSGLWGTGTKRQNLSLGCQAAPTPTNVLALSSSVLE